MNIRSCVTAAIFFIAGSFFMPACHAQEGSAARHAVPFSGDSQDEWSRDFNDEGPGYPETEFPGEDPALPQPVLPDGDEETPEGLVVPDSPLGYGERDYSPLTEDPGFPEQELDPETQMTT